MMFSLQDINYDVAICRGFVQDAFREIGSDSDIESTIGVYGKRDLQNARTKSTVF